MTPASPSALGFILVAFLAAALLSFGLTPLAGRVAARLGAVDKPGGRRIHLLVVPRGGGLGIAAAFLVVAAAVVLGNSFLHLVPRQGKPGSLEITGLFLGAALAALLGFVDDRYDIRARWQLVSQGLLAALAVAAGVTIDFVNNPFGTGLILFAPPFAVAFSVFWVVGMINSINWIDGLDGLSSGVALIAALTLAAISLTPTINQPFVALLCTVLAGALLGFLPWNFHPARIFIGTAGVYLVGYVLAVLSVLGTAKVAVALLVLGVPIIDTFWIIVRRLRAGDSPFKPDRGHFHHRLLDLGLTHRRAVLVIYGLCGLLAVLSLVLTGTGQLYAFVGIVLGGGVILQLMTRRAKEALEASSYEPDSTA